MVMLTEEHMEIDKILSVTLIILAIPVTISVVVLLARLLKVIFFHGEDG
mgnify:CR=1 FL=1